MKKLIAMFVAGLGLYVSCTASPVTPAPTQSISTASAAATAPTTTASTAPPTAVASPLGGPLQFLAVQRLDARTGWISVQSGGTPVLLRTLDGGSAWERLPLAPAVVVTRLAFTDAQNGWILAQTPVVGSPATCRAAPESCKSLVLTTADGGRTLTQRVSLNDDPDRGPAVIDVAPFDARRAWITVRTSRCDPAGCAYEIRGTDDGGVTWAVLPQPAPFTATEIERASATTGWALAPMAVARGASIIGTSNGGLTWTRQAQSASWTPRALVSVSDHAAWALFFDGSSCTASFCTHELTRTTDGTTWTSMGNPATGGCGGQFSSMAFGDAQTGWIAVNLGAGGGSGTGGVLRTTDGGTTWACQTNPPNTVLVSARTPQNVWVTSRERTSLAETLWSSDDGGQTWRQVAVR